MFEGLQESQLEGALEALLFVTDEPASAITLADMLEVEPAEAEAALGRLRERLAASGGGIVLREVAGGWRLYTHPAYHELVERYVLSWDTRKLSQAALETLAIVAYSQPVTRRPHRRGARRELRQLGELARGKRAAAGGGRRGQPGQSRALRHHAHVPREVWPAFDG